MRAKLCPAGLLVVFLSCVLALTAVPAGAAVNNLVFGAAGAPAAFAEPTSAQAFAGAGSCPISWPSATSKFEMYIDPVSMFGGSFTIDQIQSISYHTVNDATNPSGVDFYLTVYTMPYVGGDASWYGNRLTGEPLYSNGYMAPSAWVWNTWTTDAGTNQLVFNDSNNSGNYGFYGAPTLADLQAGTIDWSAWTSGGSSTSIDYGSQSVLYMTLSTGSGWSSFEGYLDAITISLTTGDSYVIDLEPKTDPVYVDDDWAGSGFGLEVASGKYFGYNAFATVQDGIDNVSGSTVYVAAGYYPITSSIVCSIPVTLSGPQAGVDPRPSQGSFRAAGDTLSEAVIDGQFGLSTLLTVAADDVIVDGLEFANGTGDLLASSSSAPIKYRTKVRNCIVHNSSGDEGMQLRNVTDGLVERNLVYNTAGDGINMCCGTKTSTIQDNEVHDIGSDNGAIYVYEISDMLVQRNLVYDTSQNDGIKMGAKGGSDVAASGGQILDNTVHDTDQDGISVYASDVEVCGNEIYGSTSENGALYVAFNVDNVQITRNRIHDNGSGADARTTYGVRVGKSSYHPTNVVIHDNDITGNEEGLFNNNATGPALDAENNWWGAADGPSGDGTGTGDSVNGGNVDFDPWRLASTGVTACSTAPIDNPVTPVPEPGCITASDPCNTVSFEIARTDAVNMRGFSVTFSLSPELALCTGSTGADITEGAYLSGVSATQFYVLDNGGGSYTVDCAILGLPCGATAPTGTLFTVDVTGVTDGTGTVTVDAVTFRDCSNAPIPGTAGGSATLDVDTTDPGNIADLAAVQDKSSNGTDGTTNIDLSWSLVTSPDAVTIELYRAGFGYYPEYDDLGGSVPASPSYPPAGPWTLAATLPSSATSYSDEPTTRDYWYYAAFVIDACGNVSSASNMTDGTLNYHLGDFGTTLDNKVMGDDLSALGATYGESDGDAFYDNTVDIGPTDDNSVDGLPTTDNVIQFEDLILFAINYGQVSKPMPGVLAADVNAVSLEVPEDARGTFEVVIGASSDGTIQGLSVPLTWNAEAVEPVGYAGGELMDRQSGRGVVLSPKAGTVDAAVFGSTLSGEGELARVTFRRIGSGDPAITFGDVDARDRDNKRVELGTATAKPAVSAVTRLLPAAPNPFLGATGIRYALKDAGRVEVSVYALDGRLVRTLVSGMEPAGERTVTWDGRDTGGREVASGAYLIRFRAAGHSQTQRVIRLK